MSEHYFTGEPASRFKPGSFTARLRGRDFIFWTGAGVFSRGRVDPGTRLLVESLLLSGVEAPLDLGCGYGVIGLVIARELPGIQVYMSDPNKRAVALAVKNATVNGISNVCIKEGKGFEPWGSRQFDLIACNPPLRVGKKTVLDLFQQAAGWLLPGGSLWTVIRTAQGAKSYIRELQGIFPHVQVVEVKSGYRVIKAVKEEG